ncbi:hypothetical protein ES705_46585 [subsurface metagenome]
MSSEQTVVIDGTEYPKAVVEAFCASIPGVDAETVMLLVDPPEDFAWYGEILASHLSTFYQGWEAYEKIMEIPNCDDCEMRMSDEKVYNEGRE